MKIIKDGKKNLKNLELFNLVCPICDCEFTHNGADIQGFIDDHYIDDRGVVCPWCGHMNIIIQPHKEKSIRKKIVLPDYNSQIKKQNKENN